MIICSEMFVLNIRHFAVVGVAIVIDVVCCAIGGIVGGIEIDVRIVGVLVSFVWGDQMWCMHF